jgi:hypothetical protein
MIEKDIQYLTKLADFMNVGYEVEDGKIVRMVNNENNVTVFDFNVSRETI